MAAAAAWRVEAVGPTGATGLEVEYDASAAAHLFALAAATGGTVTVTNADPATLQPDAALPALLEAMGASVTRDGARLTVRGPAALGPVDADLAAMPDQVTTVAALAALATGLVAYPRGRGRPRPRDRPAGRTGRRAGQARRGRHRAARRAGRRRARPRPRCARPGWPPGATTGWPWPWPRWPPGCPAWSSRTPPAWPGPPRVLGRPGRGRAGVAGPSRPGRVAVPIPPGRRRRPRPTGGLGLAAPDPRGGRPWPTSCPSSSAPSWRPTTAP